MSKEKNLLDQQLLSRAVELVDQEVAKKAKKDKALEKMTSQSWFCVMNNPIVHIKACADMTPQEVCDYMVEVWCGISPTRACAVLYCISNPGTDFELQHIHGIFEDTTTMRATKVSKAFPGMHIDPTKGSKKEAEDYINKTGKYAEKNEIVVASAIRGEIKANQGARTDLDRIKQLLDAGMRPNQITALDIKYRRYEKDITADYMARLETKVTYIRNVQIEWHYGYTGSGKSYFVKDLIDEYGLDNVHIVSSDYDNAFDFYFGQKILVLDEYRGDFKFKVLIDVLDKYLHIFKARYISRKSFWERVIIISPEAPDELYQGLHERSKDDRIEQLYRRINKVYYHWADGDPTLEDTVRDYVTLDNLYSFKKQGLNVRTELNAAAEIKNSEREKVFRPGDEGYQYNINEWAEIKEEVENSIEHQLTLDNWLRSI